MNDTLGFGLGLRPQHYQEILAGSPRIDWFEIISENYMVGGGRPLHNLFAIRERYPVVMHGVSLSLGSTDPLDTDYLDRLAALARTIEPRWISDHLCWTGVAGTNIHDLLPLPYTEETLTHVAARIHQVQDRLGRPLVLENVSSYVTFTNSHLSEWDFLGALVARTGCELLLDVNNVYVSAFNHEFDPMTYIRALPATAIRQIHLAGHENNGTHIIDTHDHPIIDDVWDLYAKTCAWLGPVATMIERDDHIPPLAELVAELDHARDIAARHLGVPA
ncbi:MAG TPA: DUF692 domain-containing protein [Dongiaceae bacterium]|nr:DUF692 domain-containing protein [Dongiaceae bacterium]